MSLPVVVTYVLPVAAVSSVCNAQPATSLALAINGSIGTGVLATSSATANFGQMLQQKILFSSAGNDSGIAFKIVGLNMANNTVSEVLTGPNATTTRSVQDYAKVLSITPQTLTGGLGTTAGTVTVGTDGTGASLWNIVNWQVTPVNIEASVVQVTTNTCNVTVQYTYDDPNNIPPGAQSVQAFNHPTMNATSVTMDGSINDPVTAVRLQVNSGTGACRFTMIQAGIGSP